MSNTSPAEEQHGATTADRRSMVVDVFIDVVLEDGPTPTPESVTARAGVSRATFFRYFSTLTELRNEAARRVFERFPELFIIPSLDEATLDERIRRFVDSRVQLHETLHALELLMRSHATRGTEAADFVDTVRRLHADQARTHFRPDLRPHSRARCDDIVAAIAVLSSVESWQQFRHVFGRSPAQTNRAWRSSIARILTDAS